MIRLSVFLSVVALLYAAGQQQDPAPRPQPVPVTVTLENTRVGISNADARVVFLPAVERVEPPMGFDLSTTTANDPRGLAPVIID